MKRLAVLLLLLASPAAAQSAPDLDRLFSHQANVSSEGWSSAYRLPVGADVLAICHRDLSDVRLYDTGGNEVPWLLDSASRIRSGSEWLRSVDAPILRAVTHTQSGRAPTTFREAYWLAGPGEPPSRASWDLVIDSARDHFVADVRVIAIGADDVERTVGTGSALRFVAPARSRLRIAVSDAGLDRIRVEIDGQDGFLDPSFHWDATRRARAGEELVIPLTILSRTHEGTETILEVARPSGVTPEALRFETSTPAFARNVQISTGEGTQTGVIWRVPGTAGAETYDVPAPITSELSFRVRIDDQDSPPLDGLTIAAVLSRPVLLYFTPVTLMRLGGGRVHAPRYDVRSLAGSWSIDQLLDGDTAIPDSSIGPIRSSPGWTDAPALAPLQRPGTAIALTDHSHVGTLTVATAREGASRIVLGADVLAVAQRELSDLRIVDDQGRQWPYLLRETESLHAAVTLGAPARDGDETRYAITLPATRVSASGLRIDPDARLVSRAARVIGIGASGDETELANTYLDRDPSGETATPIEFSLAPDRVTAISLAITDGSETPLTFRSVELVMPTRELVLVAPPGTYRLLVGDDDAAAPRYEIESVRGLLDTLPLDDATIGPLGPNPAYHAPSLFSRAGTTTVALWAVLLFAIVVLGGLTWRASRTPEPPTAPTPPPATEEEESS
jgi:hypothetical protein